MTSLFITSVMRLRADSNRCTRFCRALPSRSATQPFYFALSKVCVLESANLRILIDFAK